MFVGLICGYVLILVDLLARYGVQRLLAVAVAAATAHASVDSDVDGLSDDLPVALEQVTRLGLKKVARILRVPLDITDGKPGEITGHSGVRGDQCRLRADEQQLRRKSTGDVLERLGKLIEEERAKLKNRQVPLVPMQQPENELQSSEGRLATSKAFSIMTRSLECFGFGHRPGNVTSFFVDATLDPAESCLGATLRLEQAATTVARARKIQKRLSGVRYQVSGFSSFAPFH